MTPCVSSGSTWETPKPSCGISTPSCRVIVGTSDIGLLSLRGRAGTAEGGRVDRPVDLDLCRRHYPRDHHVLADHHQQLDDLAWGEDRDDRLERLVRRARVAQHLGRETEDGALVGREAI